MYKWEGKISGNPPTNLSTLCIGCQQIYHFDASDQDLLLHTHICELRGFSMYRRSSERQEVYLKGETLQYAYFLTTTNPVRRPKAAK